MSVVHQAWEEDGGGKESAFFSTEEEDGITWSDEHSTVSWAIAKEQGYPLFRLVLCFDIPCGNDGPGDILGREVYEGAIFAGLRVDILAVAAR